MIRLTVSDILLLSAFSIYSLFLSPLISCSLFLNYSLFPFIHCHLCFIFSFCCEVSRRSQDFAHTCRDVCARNAVISTYSLSIGNIIQYLCAMMRSYCSSASCKGKSVTSPFIVSHDEVDNDDLCYLYHLSFLLNYLFLKFIISFYLGFGFKNIKILFLAEVEMTIAAT